MIRPFVFCKRGHRIEQGRGLDLNVLIRVLHGNEERVEAALQNVVAEGKE